MFATTAGDGRRARGGTGLLREPPACPLDPETAAALDEIIRAEAGHAALSV